MSNYTNITFYENEERTIRILVRDQDENDFTIDTASCYVVDTDGNTIVDTTTCSVSGNIVFFSVDTTITETKGIYYVIWTIIRLGKVYKHKTILNVAELD